MRKSAVAGLVLGLVALALTPCAPAAPQEQRRRAATGPEQRYLAFQVFTGSANLNVPPGGELELDALPFAAGLIARVGSAGTANTRLALILGPIAFDHTDTQVAALIASGFDLALTRGVAIGFHIDESMYWGRRSELLADAANIERAGWNGLLSTGWPLDWGPQPSPAPPRMCINSLAIETEVRRRGARVIGVFGTTSMNMRIGESYRVRRCKSRMDTKYATENGSTPTATTIF